MKGLQNACDKSINTWVQGISVEDDIKFSNKHISKINSIKEGRYVCGVFCTQNALRVLLVCTLILVLSIFASALLIKNFNLVYNHNNGYSLFSSNNKINEEDLFSLDDNCIPDNYTITSEVIDKYNKTHSVTLENNDNYIKLIKTTGNTNIFTNYNKYKTIIINDIEYNIFSNNNQLFIYWQNNDYSYLAETNLSEAEVLNIVKNIN